jgi:hypothetical protein
MVNSKLELIELIKLHTNLLHKYGVKDIYLFGSFSRNEVTEKSDVDLLIDFESNKKTLMNIIEIGDFLESIFGRKVDIITRNDLSKFIGPHILNSMEHLSLAA